LAATLLGAAASPIVNAIVMPAVAMAKAWYRQKRSPSRTISPETPPECKTRSRRDGR